MSYQFPPDLDKLVRERMATDNYSSEDELLRSALLALSEEEEDLAAVNAAIAELEAGDAGIPLDQAFDDVRRPQAECFPGNFYDRQRVGPNPENSLRTTPAN
jgi:Arc/MetJ-type ribon-helix-helix transcriptional regulator